MKVKRATSSKILLLEMIGLSISLGIILFDFYLSFTKSQITEEQGIAIKPLDGQIENGVIENLKGRVFIRDIDLDSLNNISVISVAQTATKSANINVEAPPTEVSLPGNISGQTESTASGAISTPATESTNLQVPQ